MVSDIARYLVLSIAMVLFLAAAQASAGLSWRASEPPPLMLGALKTYSTDFGLPARDASKTVSIRF
jgi:hypothetical protein